MTQELDKIIGKIIQAASYKRSPFTDDTGFLELTFTDNTKVTIVGGYRENYTGKSFGEYPTRIWVQEGEYTVVDPIDNTDELFPLKNNL